MPTTTAATATVAGDAESACRLAYTGDFPKLIALFKSYRAHAAGEAATVTCAVSHPKKWSALHQAVYHAARASNSTSDASTQQQRVEQLVALGVDPTLKNVAGKTAADLAEEEGLPCAAYLRALTKVAASSKASAPSVAFPALGPHVVEDAAVFGSSGSVDPFEPVNESTLPPASQEDGGNVMVLHGAGDAIGYARGNWEFNYRAAEIHEECRQLGGVPALNVTGRGWIVSDDTVMHIATAEAMLSHMGPKVQQELMAQVDAKTGVWKSNPYTIASYRAFAEKLGQDYVLSFHDMHHRAPGGTCEHAVRRLESGKAWDSLPYFDRKANCGCGGAMRSNCIGIALRGRDRRPLLVAVAVEAGRMSHNHPAGMLGSLVPALFTAYALERIPVARWGRLFVEEAIPLACKYVDACKRDATHVGGGRLGEPYASMWREFCKLRGIWKPTDTVPTRARRADILLPGDLDKMYGSCFGGWAGWDGYSAPLIAYDALLASGASWPRLVARAALHGGDSDSTMCIAAGWFAALYGVGGVGAKTPAGTTVAYAAVPKGCYSKVEYHDRLAKLGKQLWAHSLPLSKTTATPPPPAPTVAGAGAGGGAGAGAGAGAGSGSGASTVAGASASAASAPATSTPAVSRRTTWEAMPSTFDVPVNSVILAVADLHGHVELLDRAIVAARAMIGPKRHLCVITVGDYVDNGPRVPQTVERLMELHSNPPPNTTVRSIAGNHDIAAVLAATDGKAYDAKPHDWFSRWNGYWNPDVPNTAEQYVALAERRAPKAMHHVSSAKFRAAMDPAHLSFLQALPWVLQLRVQGSRGGYNYTFVHAGLHEPGTEALRDQFRVLRSKSLAHLAGGWLPDQVRDKRKVPIASSAAWRSIVVSGHTKFMRPSDFVTETRLTFHSGACQGEGLHCALFLDPSATDVSAANTRQFVVDSVEHRDFTSLKYKPVFARGRPSGH